MSGISTAGNQSSKRPKSRPKFRSPGSSTTSVRSRVESETDFEEILSPQPRHPYLHLLQPWLYNMRDTPSPLPASPSPFRSSPLRPGPHGSSMSVSSPTPFTRQFQGTHPKLGTLDDDVDSMARRWVRWMAKANMRPWIAPLILGAALLLRWTVGLGQYSGYGTPPMFGDYEAQRHWMELTIHLPMRDWYFYDLPYWGLDYPPLTAYVSWLCGIIGHWMNPEWVAFESSRGVESPDSKTFMRATVLALDALIYVPAVFVFCRNWWNTRSRRTQSVALLTVLFQPALVIIDHGHFQYNSVMLGLVLWALNFFHAGHDLLGAICFVLSLGFKQMALYYSPAIFAYLLGKCFYLNGLAGRRLFLSLATVSSLTFLALFAPFYWSPLQPFIRIFPFSRGLFEDKVANFWCASDVVVKWRNMSIAATGGLAKLALLTTLLAILPPVIHLLRLSWLTRRSELDEEDLKETTTISSEAAGPAAVPTLSPKSSPAYSVPPTIRLLPYALFNTSIAFFLFSFQVHEKSILLPLMPITLLMSGRENMGKEIGIWEWGVLANNVALFSMWPLLRKDGQGMECFVLVFLWNHLIGYSPLRMPLSLHKLLALATYSVIAVLHLAEFTISPPARYPDLYPVLNAVLCAGVFGIVWLVGMKKQFEAGWAIAGLGGRNRKGRKEPKANASPGPSLSSVEEEKHGQDAEGGPSGECANLDNISSGRRGKKTKPDISPLRLRSTAGGSVTSNLGPNGL
ncbi:glycosyltransferase family 57 protein [Botryobasidium botryosum FD-172 SS1]|uniref:Alpha-1,3-glucosyltransferase n=1 Tax=Botryobasidium botryosum (strain FD-172 SS1) TaxID=930990 RepID=A0A067MT08_BOTB1|nr:glycosyltransferase family 57 protein [Botryobasidium botryosum FD-172 SS1]